MAEQLANNAASTLNGTITSGATTLTVANGTVFPATGNFRILIDSELILVGARAGNTLSSLTRGIESTTGAAHSNGVMVTHVVTKGGLDQYLAERGELAYAEFTANVNITATVEASANTVVTAPAVTFDGTTTVLIEFFCAAVQTGTTSVVMYLFEDGASIGMIATSNLGATVAAPFMLARRRIPASGSRTYSFRATVGGGTGIAYAGSGGVAGTVPGFIRISRI